MNCSFNLYEVTFIVSSDWFESEIYFVRYEYGYFCLFMESIWLENFFPSFDFKSVFIFFSEMSLF
jgi:hypothetical protein